MKVTQTPLPGVLLIEPTVFRDPRGFFFESYNEKRFAENGLPSHFVQDNHSKSVAGTLRGLHAQLTRPQGKLVRVLEGEIFDVAVDVRRSSPTYKKWYGVRLSADNFLQLYVPPGYVHGFAVLSERVQMEYKVTDVYDPKDEITILWSDPDIGIAWPIENPLLSEKDRRGVLIKDAESRLPN